MPTPMVNLHQVSLLTEIVLRGGDVAHPASRQSLEFQYEQPNSRYLDLVAGLSCLFRPGASLDELAREGLYPNPSLSVAIIERLITELATIGCELALYVTPIPHLPDHHTLAILRNGSLEITLRDEVLNALIRAITVVKNPYQSRRPQEATSMRIVETALWPPEQPEPFGKGVYIGLEQRPDLAGLTEGERVLLVEPNEVQIEGVVHKVTVNSRVFWFGEFQGEYQVIYQEAPDLSAKP